ncbi:MAG: replication initiation protein [Bacteroidota bacterium]
MDNVATTDKTLFQHNAITEAKYDLSASQKNIIYLMMSQLRKQDTAETMYYVSVKELQRRTGAELKYSQIKQSVDDLVGATIELVSENGNPFTTTFFSSAEYLIGEGMIELGMDGKLRPYYFNLKRRFTAFQLNAAMSVKGKYTKRIYEMLSQYKDQEKVVKEIDELKRSMGIIDKKSGKDSYPRWALFEERVIKKAQKELKEHTDLVFTYSVKRRGRKITTITFNITYREVQSQIQFDDQNESACFQRLVSQFKLRKDQALAVISRYTPIEINKQLYQIQVKKSDRKISNIGAFTAKAFDVVKKQEA